MVVYKDENANGFCRLVNSQLFLLISGNSCTENPKPMYMLLEMHSVVCVGIGVVKEGRGSTEVPP